LADFHFRYRLKGAVAFHVVSDLYVALFTHFIPPGVWEAVYIIEALMQNRSTIQPDTVFADTQGQSTPVFAFTHLLGIQLMPRIRNWKDLRFYRPAPHVHYQHIDSLFTEVIDWEIIETYWQDLMQVSLSIYMGRLSVAHPAPETGELEPQKPVIPGCARGWARQAHDLSAPLDFGCRVAQRCDGRHQ
jgi:TnpA family transposase